MQRRLFNGIVPAVMAVAAIAALIAGMPRNSYAMPQDAVAALSADTLTFAAPTVEDLAVLKKAVDTVQKNGILIASDVQMRMVGNGVVVHINENLKVVGRFPDKFRSEVSVLDEDGKTAAAKFLVTSDASNVATYRSTTKEYATQELSAFKGNFAAFTPSVGVVAGVVAAGPQWVGDEAPSSEEGVKAFTDELKKLGLELTTAKANTGQRVFELHQVSADGNGFRVRLSVEPLTGGFVAAQMTANQGGWKITLTENIRSLAKLSEEALGSFTFQAPADAKKIDKLSVWPF